LEACLIKAGIVGATGYTGIELLRLLRRHPKVELAFATSEQSRGQTLAETFPTLDETKLIAALDAPLQDVDVVFVCLPHLAAMGEVPRLLAAGARVIDLSADFRIADSSVYKEWYGRSHEAVDLLREAVYGLSEYSRRELRCARLVANPGCYPTATLLGVLPAFEAGVVDTGLPLIIDAKSGLSGAGRSLSLGAHFVEANENLTPYSIGGVHRHVPEIAQGLQNYAKSAVEIVFTPHLVPLTRGMLCTLYLPLKQPASTNAIANIYRERYAGHPFIHVLPADRHASVHHVVRTNHCALSITVVGRTLIVVSAIDNLLKGASGQALQNMNLMFGLGEELGVID